MRSGTVEGSGQGHSLQGCSGGGTRRIRAFGGFEVRRVRTDGASRGGQGSVGVGAGASVPLALSVFPFEVIWKF